jgi:hypothetical protein
MNRTLSYYLIGCHEGTVPVFEAYDEYDNKSGMYITGNPIMAVRMTSSEADEALKKKPPQWRKYYYELTEKLHDYGTLEEIQKE